MHFEILVEDISSKKALDILVPKILNTEQHTFNIHAYKGIGHIPKNLKSNSDPQKRILLDQLPRLIRGYGNTFASYPSDYQAVLIVICDLDDRCLSSFRKELLEILNSCHPQPKTQFCIAIEEGEAWYLGDLAAVKNAYPSAKEAVLNSYTNDEICGTWEKLADALYSGGCHKLSKLGYQVIGKEKATWAERISPLMDIDNNQSPSFCYFRDKLRLFSGQ
ncbi:hypothetical protein Nos7524_4705 [Nostoc sp. PCC 7524]|uniref:DUF4276 family protein n=1 Tax=Nostoc sp. (strain ATCC 29411 / PCC 7524) TaxID=28072 RepID=UPI00029ECAFA|nr:DUF4276 family protein [Nostoc sp. PCC 7524]AFY50449.1 hypothetical protein Nos7524_4705 [Nostoc sp. PCC 7524]